MRGGRRHGGAQKMETGKQRLLKIREAAFDSSSFSLLTLTRIDDLLEDLNNGAKDTAEEHHPDSLATLETARNLVRELHDAPHRLLLLESEVYALIQRVQTLGEQEVDSRDDSQLDATLESLYQIDLEVSGLDVELAKEQADRVLRSTPAKKLSLPQLLAISLLLRLLPKYGQLLQLVDTLFQRATLRKYGHLGTAVGVPDAATEANDGWVSDHSDGDWPPAPVKTPVSQIDPPKSRIPQRSPPKPKPESQPVTETLAQRVNRIVNKTVPDAAVAPRQAEQGDKHNRAPPPSAVVSIAQVTPVPRRVSWRSMLRRDDPAAADELGAWFSITLWDGATKDLFCRVVGRQVMVRVGGGYEELSSYLRTWCQHHSPVSRGRAAGARRHDVTSFAVAEDGADRARFSEAKLKWAAEASELARDALMRRRASSIDNLKLVGLTLTTPASGPRVNLLKQPRAPPLRPSPLGRDSAARRPSTAPMATTGPE